ncbi:Rpn family recombination-promoting nuclease/putative transposase [Orbaceae bacterium ac157xtp]
MAKKEKGKGKNSSQKKDNKNAKQNADKNSTENIGNTGDEKFIIPHSHDSLFKLVMQDGEFSQEFVEIYAPKEILNLCDINTLKIEPTSFIDEDLKPYFCDMLFSIKTKKNQSVAFYFLVEMQSTPDPQIAYRLMSYAFKAMGNHQKRYKSKKYPLVIPILYFCGVKPHPKSIPMCWFDLFECPELAREYYNKDFPMYDLLVTEDDEIKQRKRIGFFEYVFKYIRIRALMKMANDILYFLKISMVTHSLTNSILIYALNRGKIDKPQTFINELIKNSNTQTGEDNMVSVAQYLQDIGRQEGINEGVDLGLRKGYQNGEKSAKITIAKNLLSKGINIEIIKESTGLKDDEIQTLM